MGRGCRILQPQDILLYYPLLDTNPQPPPSRTSNQMAQQVRVSFCCCWLLHISLHSQIWHDTHVEEAIPIDSSIGMEMSLWALEEDDDVEPEDPPESDPPSSVPGSDDSGNDGSSNDSSGNDSSGNDGSVPDSGGDT